MATGLKNSTDRAAILVENEDGSYLLKCQGKWTLKYITNVVSGIKRISKRIPAHSNVSWDISAVEEFDSAGIILLQHYVKEFEFRFKRVDIVGASSRQKKTLTLFQQEEKEPDLIAAKDNMLSALLQKAGEKTLSGFRDIIQFITFIGEITVTLLYSVLHPSSIRFKAIIKNIEEAGVKALPIVAVTAFLIGIVVSYQASVQLEKLGANIFIVEMIAISITRELAPLIIAIVVAGRSGASYTAQIGVMKITEEVNAMKTMSFDPIRFLVLPRIVALMIAMPLLIFFADIVGIAAGMMIADTQMNISYTDFIFRLQSVLDSRHVWIGIIKAPFFALLIATVGCFRGFQVSYNSESIGKYTTTSVVNAIFLVIACDAVFSIILTELGI
ncbi:MAG: ABC transporter permease [Gammaproteobacteria bacterium]|jgi:phospholipid/cholesterol/gamma-HCH transport system permease protein|nr:ABC transporter permease [Gammaproteobacteria bacterium]